MLDIRLWVIDPATGTWVPIQGVASGNNWNLQTTATISGTIDSWSKGATLVSTAVTVGASATSLVAADATRRAVTIFNNHASNTLYVGAAGVTTATGIPIGPGSNATFYQAPAAAWFGIASGAGTDVRVLEEKT